MTRPAALRLAAQLGLAAAMAAGLVVALGKPNDAGGLLPWDKAQHFLAFYGFAGLAAAALPGRSLWTAALVVAGYGTLIEVLQALPVFHRDGDWVDLMVDCLGIGCCYLPLALVRWRAWTAPRP
jgi:hypothetical protein